MSFYDAFKDVLSVAQKADNVELYKKLLDLSAQALDLQAEIARLKEETISLPVTENGIPNWQLMEDYINSLPYSKYL